jgi:hypothetical protein
MFKRLLSPPEQSRAAKTVEIYGWIIFLEGGLLLLFPDFMARLMHFGPLTPQASGFLRLIGMLVSGFGMLYFVSGRLNAEGFVFATLIDHSWHRPWPCCGISGRSPARWRSYLPWKTQQAGSGLW